MKSVKPPNSIVFLAQSLSQPSTTSMRSAPRVLTSINSTFPAMPGQAEHLRVARLVESANGAVANLGNVGGARTTEHQVCRS